MKELCSLTLIVRFAPQDAWTADPLFFWAPLAGIVPRVRVGVPVPRAILWVRRDATVQVRVVDVVGLRGHIYRRQNGPVLNRIGMRGKTPARSNLR